MHTHKWKTSLQNGWGVALSQQCECGSIRTRTTSIQPWNMTEVVECVEGNVTTIKITRNIILPS